MASIIWKLTKKQMNYFSIEDNFVHKNPSTWVIAKGNIIEGIEAKW